MAPYRRVNLSLIEEEHMLHFLQSKLVRCMIFKINATVAFAHVSGIDEEDTCGPFKRVVYWTRKRRLR